MKALTLHSPLSGIRQQLPLIAMVKRQLDLLIISASLYAVAFAYDEPFLGHYWVLTVIAYFVSAVVFDKLDLFQPSTGAGRGRYLREIMLGWVIVIAILLFLGYVTKYSALFSRRLLLTWFAVVPFLLSFLDDALARTFVSKVLSRRKPKPVIILGAGEAGLQLAHAIDRDLTHIMQIRGFFDERGNARIALAPNYSLLGTLADVSDYVRRNNIATVYVALPMSTPRVLQTVQDLQDTTASVYFVPDLFPYNLVQAKFDNVDGVPIIGICDTPFAGVDGLLKRASDLVLASVLLLLVWPLLAALAVGVKISSPGPVFFRQRRHGLNGKEFHVLKFRTMTVCEDGTTIVQAKRRDARVTKFGAFLRHSSLDEIPQLINVLRGDMSIVGPRPHALAHNAEYRKAILGYMIRHKVRPGITGWAQIHGLRGETNSVEKMRARVEADLEYLRNWSLWLDLRIILRTIAMMFKDRNAY